MRKVGYVALDDGPRLTLEALAASLRGVWLRPGPAGSEHWEGVLRAEGIEVLVCGTSNSTKGRSAEAGASAAAHALRIPSVVVEDFPGNFVGMPGTPPRLLCVESEFAAALAHRQIPGLATHIGPAIRYDALRRKLGALRIADDGHAEDAVLWIGQPETEDALHTLAVVLPALRERGLTLWFRAHPRDEGYTNGAYAGMLGRSQMVEDMTENPLDDCLRRRPRLVITQFSSVAVEAGFWGIPSLNVLLSHAGGDRLLEKNGYRVPPWCDSGAAFLVTGPQEMSETLESATRSEGARKRVQERFDEYFKVREEGAPVLVKLLYNQGLL